MPIWAAPAQFCLAWTVAGLRRQPEGVDMGEGD